MAIGWPLLHPDVRVAVIGGATTLTRAGVALSFEGADPAAVVATASALDGRDRSASAESLASVIARETRAAGLARVLDARTSLSGPEFFGACTVLFPAWKERVFSQPLWVGLAGGTASHSQFTGWVLETFHFIQAANERLPLAVSRCDDVAARALLAHHYTEEYDHGVFFLRSLATLGVREGDARASRPLPGTLAVMNHMRRAGRLDWLAYAACSGFLESTGADRERALAFFAGVASRYGSAPVEPMVSHVRLDEQFGHGDLFESACAGIAELPVARASQALTAVLELVEALELWAEDISAVYEHACRPPRGLHRYREMA